MLKLYEHPLSPYAQKVKLALYEKGIGFEAVVPNFLGGGVEAEFAASSPRLVQHATGKAMNRSR